MSLREVLTSRWVLLVALPMSLVVVPTTSAAPAVPTVAAPPAAAPAPEAAPAPAPAAPVQTLAVAAPAPAPTGPASWSDRRLAASLVLAGYDMSRTDDALPWLQEGLGGVVLFGRPPADLAARLARLRAAGEVVPLVASDEEGGLVQRLRDVLGALPSAETMGATRTPWEVQQLAAGYGLGMARLGVDVDLAPVADLAVPGRFIERTDRAFSGDPATVSAYAGAWQAGMRSAGVAPVIKHWPGHGGATDTHDRAATIAPLAELEGRDLLPFGSLLEAGAPAVMVGHLEVPGLTEPGTPATLSPSAYRYLREHGAADRLVLTDSLSMGAIRVGAGLSPAEAAVRALSAGADAVLVDPGPGPGAVVDAVAAALTDGRYPRAAAVASAERVLAVKRTTNAPLPAVTSAAKGARRLGQRVVLDAVVDDRVGGELQLRVYVRSAGSATWDVVDGGLTSAPAGSRASYAVPEANLAPGRAYEWTARTCNAAGLCSAPAAVGRFTTRPR